MPNTNQPTTTTTTTTTIAPANPTDQLLDSFRSLKIELRSDVQITRQLLRGKPTYVIHDPVSFKTHRLSLNDYSIVAHLRDDLTLHQCFGNAVAAGLLDDDDESDFYQFVARLHSLGILSIPNYDAKTLYQRHQSASASASKLSISRILFVSLPLANPDRFLDRTIGRVRFLFSPAMFAVWVLSGIMAAIIVATRWTEFITPLNGVLAYRNLLFIVGTFVALKVWHELGHGYACKHFGGRVPEMGAKLIAGLPLAYVDASAAWGFPRRRDRILVMVGGMYFESLVAIPAVFVWAFTSNALIASCAYQLIFMAGVATVLFNANPLMKFDGYFVLSDLLGLPNLRQQATAQVKQTLCYHVLGLPRKNTDRSRRDTMILLSYGISAAVYSVVLVISISAVVASRFYFVGIAFAACQLISMAWGAWKKTWVFLTQSAETEPVRDRSRRVAYGLAATIPMLVGFCPVNTDLRVSGVISAATRTAVTARTPGILDSVHTAVGERVEAGTPIAKLRNLQTEQDYQIKQAVARRASLEVTLATNSRENSLAAKLRPTARQASGEADAAKRIHDQLTIRASTAGTIAFQVSPRERGTFVISGQTIATVVSGQTTVKVYLDQEQYQHAKITPGQSVDVALSAEPTRTFVGKIGGIDQGATRQISDRQLTTESEGSIVVDPITGEATTGLYRVEVELPRAALDLLVNGSTATVSIDRPYESLGGWAVRKTYQFLNKILLS